MPINKLKDAEVAGDPRRQSDGQLENDDKTQAGPSGPAIELADLSMGVEADVGRLRSSLTALAGDISQIRSEHVGLAADYLKLTDELRDIKLVLAKVHAKELHGIEQRASWMDSLRRLGQWFDRCPSPPSHRKYKSASAHSKK